MSISKDSKVESLRLQQKSLSLKADLVAGTSESASLVSIDNEAIASTTIEVDIKEPVSSCEKAQVINRTTGQSVALSGAPSVSDSKISVTLDATGLSDVCISVEYRN